MSLAVRICLAAVWIIAGYLKLIDQFQTELALSAYQILPRSSLVYVAAALPMCEIALGVLLLLGIFTRWASVVSVLVFILFMGAIVSAWARGLRLDCGCFGGGGVSDGVTSWTYIQELLRDCGFTLLGVWLVAFPRSVAALEPTSRG